MKTVVDIFWDRMAALSMRGKRQWLIEKESIMKINGIEIKSLDTYLEQFALEKLGFSPGKLDGDKGPETKSARAAWESSLAPAQAAVSPFVSRLISVARAEVGTRETSKNQGAGIAKYWEATTYPDGYKNREPYCAAFVCWAVREAAEVLPSRPWGLPTSPVAYDAEKWASANSARGVSLMTPGTTPKAGDIFTLSAASHVGIVVAVKG
jgi:peptidoglycan hydrolase-like protein with peptidoglycan-binding domain